MSDEREPTCGSCAHWRGEDAEYPCDTPVGRMVSWIWRKRGARFPHSAEGMCEEHSHER